MKIKSIVVGMVILLSILIPVISSADFFVKIFTCDYNKEINNAKWLCYSQGDTLAIQINNFIKEVNSQGHKIVAISYEPIEIYEGSTGGMIVTIKTEDKKSSSSSIRENNKSWLWED